MITRTPGALPRRPPAMSPSSVRALDPTENGLASWRPSALFATAAMRAESGRERDRGGKHRTGVGALGPRTVCRQDQRRRTAPRQPCFVETASEVKATASCAVLGGRYPNGNRSPRVRQYQKLRGASRGTMIGRMITHDIDDGRTRPAAHCEDSPTRSTVRLQGAARWPPVLPAISGIAHLPRRWPHPSYRQSTGRTLGS